MTKKAIFLSVVICAMSLTGCTQIKRNIAQRQKHQAKQTANECDPHTDAGMSNGWGMYYCDDRGQWKENLQAEAYERKIDNRKVELAQALVTRVLTPAEMTEVLQWGPDLLTHNFESYNEDDIRKRYLFMLDVQRELREINAIRFYSNYSGKTGSELPAR